MQISNFPHHIFWSYKPDAELPDEVIAEQVLLYGDVEDMFLLTKLIPYDKITQAKNIIEATGRWQKRIYFISNVVLSK